MFDNHGARLYRYAVLILADPAAAEDVVQDAFCQLARMQQRNAGAIALPYAIRVVRNACYTLLRKRRVRVSEAPLLEAAAPDATEEDRLLLDEAVRRLPPEQREVVVLKIFDGLTFQEIADLSGVSINTAASRYRYAMAALRRALAPAEEQA